MTLRAQRTRSLFFDKKDTAKKEFLSSLLGLDEIDAAIEQSKERIKQFDSKIQFLQSSSLVLEQEEKSIIEPIPYPIPVEAELLFQRKDEISFLVPILESKERDALLKIKSLKSKLEVRIKDIEQNYVLAPSNVLASSQWVLDLSLKQKTLVDLQNYQKELNKTLDKIGQSKIKLIDINGQIDQLNKSICPTCERTWIENQGKLQFLEQSQKVLELDINREHIVQKDLADSFIEENDLIKEINKLALDLKNEDIRLSVEESKHLTEKADKINELKIASMVHIGRIQQASIRIKDHILNHKMILSSIQQKENEINLNKQKSDLSIRDYSDKLLSIKLKTQSISSELVKINKERAKELDFIELVGNNGFKGSIFSQVLVEIGDKISETLKYVPNMSGCTMEFRSSTETEKGVAKAKITPIINKNGLEIAPELLSGGQLSTLSCLRSGSWRSN